MKNQFTKILNHLEANHSLMMITIIKREGSAPREVGARMYLTDTKEVDGSIGGGRIEYLALKVAAKLLQEQQSQVSQYHLGNEQAAAIGMVCGGDIWLSYQYLSADIKGQLEVIRQIVKAGEANENIWLTMEMGKAGGQEIGVAFAGSNHPTLVESNGSMYYTDPILKTGTVYIFGGGHVSKELTPLLVYLGFSCVVYDDREEYANSQEFPSATRIICEEFGDIEKHIKLNAEDYVVSMTRGHLHDIAVQAWALKQHPCYIGVIGSKRKVEFSKNELLKQGFSTAEIASCHSPIGLDIGADTPQEIAVSVAAELIEIRHKNR
jgi:Xanthine and CO dehydrogenases maturation factor, XdhC/CoxF family